MLHFQQAGGHPLLSLPIQREAAALPAPSHLGYLLSAEWQTPMPPPVPPSHTVAPVPSQAPAPSVFCSPHPPPATALQEPPTLRQPQGEPTAVRSAGRGSVGNLPGALYPNPGTPGPRPADGEGEGSEGVGGDGAAETGREGEKLQAQVSGPQRCTAGAWGAGGATGGGGGVPSWAQGNETLSPERISDLCGTPSPQGGDVGGAGGGRRRGRGTALTGRAPSGRWSPVPAATRSGLWGASGRLGGRGQQAGRLGGARAVARVWCRMGWGLGVGTQLPATPSPVPLSLSVCPSVHAPSSLRMLAYRPGACGAAMWDEGQATGKAVCVCTRMWPVAHPADSHKPSGCV